MGERYEGLGLLLTTLRESLKLTQADLAERVKVTRLQVIRWEKGENAPDAKAPAVAQELHLELDHLLLLAAAEKLVYDLRAMLERGQQTVQQLDELLADLHSAKGPRRIARGPT